MRIIVLFCTLFLTAATPAFARGNFSINGTLATSFLSWNLARINSKSYEPTLQGSVLYSNDTCRFGLWGSWVTDDTSAAREVDLFGGCKVSSWLDLSLYYMDIGPTIGDSANWITTHITVSGTFGSLSHRYVIETSHSSPTGFQDVRFDSPQWKTQHGDLAASVIHKWSHSNGPHHSGVQIKWTAPKKWQLDVGRIALTPSVQIYKTIGDLKDQGIVLSLDFQ